MLPFDFLTDPVGWVRDQYLWYFTAPAWVVAANFLFWPALFLRAWLMDEWNRRQRVRRKKLADAS